MSKYTGELAQLWNHVHIWQEKGDPDDWLYPVNKILEDEPQNIKALHLKAIILGLKKDWDKGVNTCREALELVESWSISALEGRLFFNKGDYRSAEIIFLSAMRCEGVPESARAELNELAEMSREEIEKEAQL